jgi:subtilase family serine protease
VSGRLSLRALLLLASAVLVVVFVGAAAADPGGQPRLANGHGHWFKSVCESPAAKSASCSSEVVTDEAGTPLAGPTPPAGAFGPDQFHGAYSLPLTASTPQTIGIVDAYDDPTIESDLGSFSSAYGLPQCTSSNGCFRKVNQSSGTTYPASDSGWALEIALDVEVAHEICENCNILLVEANSNSFSDLLTAENEAVALGANVVSNSWGGNEFVGENTFDPYFNHPGVAITVSAGDAGYGVEYPAASPYVTAVGGTTLNLGSGNTYGTETVWSGSGSGCSKYESKPAWQSDGGCSKRTVADVAADADPNSGAGVYDSVPYNGQSGWFQVGGTSLSAPLIAAVYALTGTASSANYGATPYGNPAGLHDVTSGSNGRCGNYLCNAGTGYDGPTGLGTPKMLGAFTAGASSPPPDFSLAATPSSRTVTQSAGTTYTVTLNTSNGFSDPVNLSASGLPSGTTASFSPPSISGNAAASTMSVNVGAATTPGTYIATITGADAANVSLSHTTAVTLIVQAPPTPDFSISVSPTTQTVRTPGTAPYTVTVTAVNGFSGTVTLKASGLPGSLTATLSPTSVTGSGTSTLTIKATQHLRSTTTFTITGTSGSLSHSTVAKLTAR